MLLVVDPIGNRRMPTLNDAYCGDLRGVVIIKCDVCTFGVVCS
jgi:hypothetical protein